jgi:hypothetical protein
VFGQAAVTVDGNDLLTGAELLGALLAERAVETRLLLVPDTDDAASDGRVWRLWETRGVDTSGRGFLRGE